MKKTIRDNQKVKTSNFVPEKSSIQPPTSSSSNISVGLNRRRKRRIGRDARMNFPYVPFGLPSSDSFSSGSRVMESYNRSLWSSQSNVLRQLSAISERER